MVCNSGVGLTPVIDGPDGPMPLHLSAGGLYDGLVLLGDDETRSYWHHITGEAVCGPLAGARMEMWGVELTTLEVALDRDPRMVLHRSRPGLFGRAMGWVTGLPGARGWLPPGMRLTMGSAPDKRLPQMEIGLGVLSSGTKRFYPMASMGDGFQDTLDGKELRVEVDPRSGVPTATWPDGARPPQIFSRWYGFSRSFPGCEIYQEQATP